MTAIILTMPANVLRAANQRQQEIEAAKNGNKRMDEVMLRRLMKAAQDKWPERYGVYKKARTPQA